MKKYFDKKINDEVFFASKTVFAKSVRPLAGYRLFVEFSNGEKKIYDAKPLLEKKIFSPLKNKTLFNSARVEFGTVVWNGELDLCPEDLYENSFSKK